MQVQVEADAPAYRRWPAPVVEAQRLAQTEWDVVDDAKHIQSYLPQQHRLFYENNVQFIPLATKDADGRVWCSIVAAGDGLTGFAHSPDRKHLHLEVETWRGDPIRRTWGSGRTSQLVGGVGVELRTRRRNKFAGQVDHVQWGDEDDGGRQPLSFDVTIKETLGNCPKYILSMTLTPLAPAPSPPSPLSNLDMGASDVLPPSVISFVHHQPMLFLATSFLPSSEYAAREYPAKLGSNHRGGRRGFVRVRSDGRTLVIPDLSGNRHMTSLGNIISDPHCGLVFPDFETGDVLYLTGTGKTIVDDEATKIMPRATRITLFAVTGYTLVQGVLPFRAASGSIQDSPYSPPVRFLAEEQAVTSVNDLKVKLANVKFHTEEGVDEKDATLATFTFEASSPPKIIPGHYAVFDLTGLIGANSYQHMVARGEREANVNDDGIRTWTVSAPPSPDSPATFSITVRKVPGGKASPRLFSRALYQATKMRERDEAGSNDFIPTLELPLLGYGGSFLLPTPNDSNVFLFVAGGIGVTPFLSFLRDMSRNSINGMPYHVHLVVSTREPTTILNLIHEASLGATDSLQLQVTLFSAATVASPIELVPEASSITVRTGRITRTVLKEEIKAQGGAGDAVKPFVCGPPAFQAEVVAGLVEAGIEEEKITMESFAY